MIKRLLFLTSFILLLSFLASAQVTTELLVHYKLDETDGLVAADTSGNGYDGTITATVTWTTGEIDGAVELTGAEHIDVPYNALGMTAVQGSVSLWVKIATGDPSSIYTLFSASDTNTGGGFGPENEMHLVIEQPGTDVWTGGEVSFWSPNNDHIFSDPDKFALGEGPGVPPVNPTLLNDDTWHHVAITWGGGVQTLYIDGLLSCTSAYAADPAYPLKYITIGSMTGGGRATIGAIDDVRIYAGPLTVPEVDFIYNKLSSVKSNPITQIDVYPNPVLNTLNIKSAEQIGQINIFDITGKSLLTRTDIGNEYHINFADFSSGVYFIQIQTVNGLELTKKIVK